MDSNIKQYEEIRKSTTRQGEDYTTGCLIDQDYIKNHYRLIAVDLSRKKIRCLFKSNSKTRLLWRVKNLDDNDNTTDDDNDQSIFVLTVLQKIKETRLKFSQGSVAVL